MPLSNWDKTTTNDRPEVVITDETSGDYVEVTPNNEIKASDIADNGGTSKELSVTSGTPAELKVGASVLANRKYILFQPQDTGVLWGFSSSAIYFTTFKEGMNIIPVGPNTEIWFDCDSGTKTVVIGEIA